MADENLTVTISMRDDLSRQVTEATKSINKLGREMDEARKAGEKTGDFSQYERLKKAYDEERQALTLLKRKRDEATRDIKAMEKQAVRSATRMQSAWKKMQGVFKSPLFTAATIAGVTLFGKRSLEAFAQAETSQMKLVEAYRKFDAVRDVPIQAIRDLASEIQSLTGTDDDALAAAAGTLARFDLTGQAIQRLLPLVNDFAIATGRDVVSASESIGKAFMGNARALRELGINFKSTGDRGKDFETILAALEAKVGGTGDAFGETAQGGLKRAQAAFSDLQEEVGGTLVPALTALLRVVEPLTSFFRGMPDPIKGVVVAIGFLGAAAMVLGPRLATMVIGMRAAGIEATAMRTKMAAAGSFIMGPWGAALAAGTVALGYFMAQQGEANARVDEFSQMIDTATGKLNQAGVQRVAEQLLGDISQEDWETLRALGITIEDVTAAVIGGEENWRAYQDQLNAIGVTVMGTGTRSIVSTLQNNMHGLRSEVDRGTRAWEASVQAQSVATSSSDDLASATGGVTRQLVVLGRELPLASYKAADYYQALQAAKNATDDLIQALSDLSAATSEWAARDNFKQSLKDFMEEPTKDAARSMINSMEQAANAIEDPGERAAFTVASIDKIREAVKKEGLKLPQAVVDAMDSLYSKANDVLTTTNAIKTSIDNLPDSKTVRLFLETYGNVPAWARQATGGWVGGQTGGPTSDTVPTLLSRGEFVLRGSAAAALRQAIGDAGMWSLNHADRSMPSFLDSTVPAIVTAPDREPALVGAGAPVINIGEIKADSGIDVQTEVMWALRRADRIKRERA